MNEMDKHKSKMNNVFEYILCNKPYRLECIVCKITKISIVSIITYDPYEMVCSLKCNEIYKVTENEKIIANNYEGKYYE